MITHREAKYVSARLQGKSQHQSLLSAGFSPAICAHPQWVVTDEMKAEVERLQAELVSQALEVGLIDAHEIHQYLSDAIRADMRDIRNEDGSFKPQDEWPAIWGQMMEAGDIEVEYSSARSHDGETKDMEGGWDRVGTVEKVKLKFANRTKLIELAMRHKGINALADQNSNININLTVTAEEQREMASAKRRRSKVIDVTPES